MDPSNSHQGYPNEFIKDTEVLPFTKYGISSLTHFEEAQKELENLENLKKCGLSDEEIKLYQDNEAGKARENLKIPVEVLELKLKAIYCKIQRGKDENNKKHTSEEASSSSAANRPTSTTFLKYPPGHPMNDIKSLEHDLFGQLEDNSNVKSLSKRRKILRRLEKRTERIMAEDPYSIPGSSSHQTPDQSSEASRNPKTLWDVKEVVPRPGTSKKKDAIIGPKPKTMYTVKDNKIVRLEPDNDAPNELRAVDIVIPVNQAEERLLEGTKMSVDDIRKIERFKDYEPGVPSKVLYLKNISPSVTREQLSILFNQYILSNGGPIDVRLMEGRMRGQAFVAFQNEDVAISALDDLNGTILMGRPIIAQFGRNTNRIQED